MKNEYIKHYNLLLLISPCIEIITEIVGIRASIRIISKRKNTLISNSQRGTRYS